MTQTQLLDKAGKKVGEVSLAENVFAIEPNEHVVHQALVRQLANARSGSANTKTRAEVSGGGRKPWRQKGTGRARAGSIRSPLWEGGGVTFGPKPRDYSISMPKKARELALKSVLSDKKANLVVVKDLTELKAAKTKEFATILKNLELSGKKVLVVLDYSCDGSCKVELAARNIQDLRVIQVSNLNVKDVLWAEAILTNESTLETINKRFSSAKSSEASAKSEETAKKPKAAKKEASSKDK
jgi:large subunit ribosomal protein L4